MVIQKYTTCEGVICEYKDCQKEAEYIQMTEDTEQGYQNGVLRCEDHKQAQG